jgi:peptidoglycan/xylan/chitin deacetylase (PgdA/CDA1 family)
LLFLAVAAGRTRQHEWCNAWVRNQEMSVRRIFDLLSPAGTSGRLTVLIYHRVLPAPDPLLSGEPDAVRFETEMRWIRTWFNVLPLAEAVERLRTVALPILIRVGLNATFFIATGYLDGGRMWNDTVIDVVRKADGPILDLGTMGLGQYPVATLDDRRHSLGVLLTKLKYLEPGEREKLANDIAAALNIWPPCDLMLTAKQVRDMADAGMTIGAHTVNHPILMRVSESAARNEMIQSKQQLESITGREVTLFAYPNGKPSTDYSGTHVRLAHEAGFSAAVSTGWGAATRTSDVYQIPRFTPWDRSGWRYAARLARNMRHVITVAH